MIKHALFAWAFVATLAACALSLPERPPVDRPGAGTDAGSSSPATTPARTAHRPGAGVIESASVASLSSSSAAAGGTASPGTSVTMAYRVKMGDGTTQDIVQSGERFAVGDRVEITREGRLNRR
jgi:hypothetical protein